MKRLNIISISLIFLMVVLPIVSAAEFGFDVSCYQGCNNGVASPDANIMLKVTIKNNFNYWVKVGSDNGEDITLRVLIENKNLGNGYGKETETHKIMGSPAYIPPKSEFEFYIPLNAYNNMERDKRVSDWVLTPTLDLQNVKCYQDPYDEEKNVYQYSQCDIQSSIAGNQVKFEGKTDEVEVQKIPGGNLIKSIFSNYWVWYSITGIFILVLGGIILGAIKKK